MFDKKILDLLACPDDKGTLIFVEKTDDSDSFLYNSRLRLKYLINGSIPILLPEAAVPVDDSEHESIMSHVIGDRHF